MFLVICIRWADLYLHCMKSLVLLQLAVFAFLACSSQVVYSSKDLTITQIAPNSFVHTSYLQTRDFGNVPCNGLLVRDENEVIVFDTPTNDKVSEELIGWIKKSLHSRINAVIPTHFHNDCLGGLKAFHDHKIPSYANYKTTALAEENKFIVPQNSFRDSIELKLGHKKIVAKYFGEGHTKDNVVGYFPADDIMFGGCLIKEQNATKGYLGDANIGEWSHTVEKVKSSYPKVKLVVPGHGKVGGREILDYTIELFRVH